MKENAGRGRRFAPTIIGRQCENAKHQLRKHKHLRLLVFSLLGLGFILLWIKPRTWWKQLNQKIQQNIHLGPCQLVVDYESNDERDFRRYRFPSFEERIKIYMGEWYLPPETQDPLCEGRIIYKPLDATQQKNFHVDQPLFWMKELAWFNSTDSIGLSNGASQAIQRFFSFDSKIAPARMFAVHPESMRQCSGAKTPQEHKMFHYCQDTQSTFQPNLPKEDASTPFLIQYGDASQSRAPFVYAGNYFQNVSDWSNPVIPHFKKFRQAWARKELQQFTTTENCIGRRELLRLRQEDTLVTQPLIWKLNIRRHFKKMKDVPCNDIPWSQKKPMAVFRGRLNGVLDREKFAHADDQAVCLAIPRCVLVLKNRESKAVDAKLTDLGRRIGGVIDGYNLTAPHALPMRQLLRYKALIILEGNDVSSGLKWALLSQSIVMMPRPRFNSWAMEEALEPWIHYVPLLDDLSDAEERLNWILQHEAEALRIVKRANLWMLDLVYHPDAQQDEDRLYREILSRYSRHFHRDDSLAP